MHCSLEITEPCPVQLPWKWFIITHSNSATAVNIFQISEIQLKTPKNTADAGPDSRLVWWSVRFISSLANQTCAQIVSEIMVTMCADYPFLYDLNSTQTWIRFVFHPLCMSNSTEGSLLGNGCVLDLPKQFIGSTNKYVARRHYKHARATQWN
jgi:hypothetical protein